MLALKKELSRLETHEVEAEAFAAKAKVQIDEITEVNDNLLRQLKQTQACNRELEAQYEETIRRHDETVKALRKDIAEAQTRSDRLSQELIVANDTKTQAIDAANQQSLVHRREAARLSGTVDEVESRLQAERGKISNLQQQLAEEKERQSSTIQVPF